MKLKLLGVALIASTVLSTSAFASGLKLGQWSVGGIQQICLVSGGTWYSPTFANWGGDWSNVGVGDDQTIIFGNYNSGAGNDSMIVEQKKIADWTEWSDDLTYTNFLDGIQFTFVKKACDAPASAGHDKSAHPME